jgi:hypothetical protein
MDYFSYEDREKILKRVNKVKGIGYKVYRGNGAFLNNIFKTSSLNVIEKTLDIRLLIICCQSAGIDSFSALINIT